MSELGLKGERMRNLLEDRLEIHSDLGFFVDLDVVLRGELPDEVVDDRANFS